ncbi:telomere-associated protein RIF1 isoform X2 [Mugil cephalus]|uniref:telomere-associated protein RIF1 isoform X2 n=1 Tax=Mugil cephalus TaxID=48193 RepID=UPI001FB7ED91|nr:telomere-associated protein RIF1 isoform X2 [Mugil cephalus]
MMATTGPQSASSFILLLESLEDDNAAQSEQTDAYLTIASRLSGEEGRQFLPAVEKHFPRLGKAILAHISSSNAELSQAALQTLGFCVYHSHIVSGVSESFAAEILSSLCSLVVKSTDKNTCTRALWVISKQSFPVDVVGKKVPSILGTLEMVLNREDIQSVVMEHEVLNVIIRMLEQVPTQMCGGAVQWAKLVIPLVVHSASKVRLRAAAAVELGMPLLLEKQMDVAAVIEPMMSSKLIPELQKLFMSKNEMNVLKLWPLFVKLLGKLLHRGGPFINSLLHLEELGFRSSSPTIKKIAFIAWKSLIDNFALNPDILCSSKRMKLLMQPLTSIHVRTEALLLTKVEVWWYLVVQLGPNLSSNFDQVSVPLLQCTIGSDSSSVPCTPSRAVAQNGAVIPGTPKTAVPGFNSPAGTPRMSLNSSIQVSSFPSIQLLGLEMLLHYFQGPEVPATAAKNKLTLSLEPLHHPLLLGTPSFTKHAAVLVSSIRDGFINIGKEAPVSLLAIIWKQLVSFVSLTIESALSVNSKKDRQGCEVLTLMLQALQSIVTSEALPADRVLVLFEATVKGISQRVLGSASYQLGKMDVLNGTPALFLIFLLYNSTSLSACSEDDRFYHCLQTLVGCGLSGPTSPLAFAEAVLGAIGRRAGSLQNKQQLWRMWSVIVSLLTDTITQSNEVNQGDALEHNFSAIHSALMLPITYLLHGMPLTQATQRSMLSSWSKLYKVFARCSALVITAEENICCEELCAKIATVVDREALMVPSTLNTVAGILQVMVECVDFSPFTPQFQQKLKSPHTPVNWTRKKNKALGNLSTLQSLLVQTLEVYLDAPEAASSCEGTGLALVSVLSTFFSNLFLANAIQAALTTLIQPLTCFYQQAASETGKFFSQLQGKLEKLLGEVLGCLQTCSTVVFDDDLLALLSPLLCVLFPHKNKQLRTLVTQFWNATFAKTASLTYPEEIRLTLNQMKQKTPIILPGFEAVFVPDELSGQYSNESSQMETKLSGMPVSSMGKRDSLLGNTVKSKDKSSAKTSKLVSMKLDFSSPKPPCRDVLEEEASIDFVFIPPETKERVLTEHQKEVKRTKRFDIPAMYNNLDASLDTMVFTQYTQGQEDSLDQVPIQQADSIKKEFPSEDPQKMEDDSEVVRKDTHDHTSLREMTENHQQEEVALESTDGSMEDDTRSDKRAEEVDVRSKGDTSPSASDSSGTPQKPNSRRQSFITLEKYGDGKPTSSGSISTFAGLLVKVSNSQVCCGVNTKLTSAGPDSQDSPQTKDTLESPRRLKDSRTKSEPVKLTERLPSGLMEENDVIPDTQPEDMASTLEEINSSSQEKDSESTLDSSQNHASPDKLRRSGRPRVRPLLPGEDPNEQESKYTPLKRRCSGPENESISTPNRPKTRSKQAAEDNAGRDRLRSRAQRESTQTASLTRPRKKIKLYSNSEDFLDVNKPDKKRRSTGGHECDHDNQTQRRRSRQSKSSQDIDKEESSQAVTQELLQQTEINEDTKEHSQTAIVSSQPGKNSHESELLEKNDDEPNKDSQILSSSPQADALSQESEPEGESKKENTDSQIVPSPFPVTEKNSTNSTDKSANEELVKDAEHKMTDAADNNLNQEDSQVSTLSSSSSQSKRRSRRSNVSTESEASSDDTYSLPRKSRSNTQTEVCTGGRTRRRSKVHEGVSTLESSQSLEISGSESSQDKGRYSTRRSSQGLAAGVKSSESEFSDTRVNPPVAKKRGRKPRAPVQSPLTVKSKEYRTDGCNAERFDADVSQQLYIQSVETDLEEIQHLQSSDSPKVPGTGEMDQKGKSAVEVDAVKEPEDTLCHNLETLESFRVSHEQTRAESLVSAVNTMPPEEKIENLQESSEEKAKKAFEPQDKVDADSDQECPLVPEEGPKNHSQNVSIEIPEERANQQTVATDLPEEVEAEEEGEEMDGKGQGSETEHKAADKVVISLNTDLCEEAVPQDSPVKQKDLEVLTDFADVAQSPSSGRTRGTWSPSASPSTSILKKGHKRPLEVVETPSPLVKFRRVSFANPIQQQELADDIDRRSPAIRTCSPRRSKVSGIPQPKHITTPTKGPLVLSPRNLHSPGYKSSKKCLISEMGQEPRPVSRDCVYPALVGCSTPVEAVLPQISSNMWSRGLGQLVRARNIKTVGDLSALTPSEIKTLPIRSPKISNVKKALKIHAQQRKGRGGDELKSFDETERITTELEDSSAPQKLDEGEKSSETLATELLDKPIPSDMRPEDTSETEMPDGDQGPNRGQHGFLPQVEALTSSMTPLELSRCSPPQLVQIHERLGGLMRRLVVELQTRLGRMDA